MNGLNNPANQSSIDRLPAAMLRRGDKIRLLSGLGINVIGASVLLAHGAPFLGWSI